MENKDLVARDDESAVGPGVSERLREKLLAAEKRALDKVCAQEKQKMENALGRFRELRDFCAKELCKFENGETYKMPNDELGLLDKIIAKKCLSLLARNSFFFSGIISAIVYAQTWLWPWLLNVVGKEPGLLGIVSLLGMIIMGSFDFICVAVLTGGFNECIKPNFAPYLKFLTGKARIKQLEEKTKDIETTKK